MSIIMHCALIKERVLKMKFGTMSIMFTVMFFIGMVVNGVKWFIIEKDFDKSSFIATGTWAGLFVIGVVLSILLQGV